MDGSRGALEETGVEWNTVESFRNTREPIGVLRLDGATPILSPENVGKGLKMGVVGITGGISCLPPKWAESR